MLCAVGQAEISYEALGQTHQPLTEGGRQSRLRACAAFDGIWCSTAGDCFPSANSCFISSPSNLAYAAYAASSTLWLLGGSGQSEIARSNRSTWCPPARRFATGWPPLPSLATGVGNSEYVVNFAVLPVGQDKDPFSSVCHSNITCS